MTPDENQEDVSFFGEIERTVLDDSDIKRQLVGDSTPEEPQPTPAQLCAGAFLQLEFDLFNYDAYDTYFDETSTLTLAQAGTYTGPDGIKEYVKFADVDSPYIRAKRSYERNSEMTDFDPTTNICKFTTYFFEALDLNPAFTAGDTINFGGIINTYYSATTSKIPTVHLYYTETILELTFMQLQTRQVDEFVCDTLLGPGCMDKLGDQAEQGLTKRKCLQRLSNLPLAGGEDIFFDGYSQSCRYVHSVFAGTNPFHCAHISFFPVEDLKGKIKCQTSADMSPEELFSQTEIVGLYTLCGNQTSLGLDQDNCAHRIQNSTPNSKKSKKSAKK